MIHLQSCIYDGTDTIVLPRVTFFQPIEDVVPESILKELKLHMNIYRGTNPPLIEGVYEISPFKITFSSINEAEVGKTVSNGTIRFSDQETDTDVLTFSQKQGISATYSDEVSIIGDGNNFTTYFLAKGVSSRITTEEIIVISGIKSKKGVQSLEYAFVMMDKGSDKNEELVDENTFRIFKDSDGISETTVWDKSSMILAAPIPSIFNTNSKLSEE